MHSEAVLANIDAVSQTTLHHIPPHKALKSTKKKYARRYGSRYEVFDSETALQTRGGLKKEDLMLSRTGKIVSKKKSLAAKALYEQYGYKKREVKKSPPKKRGRKKKTTKK